MFSVAAYKTIDQSISQICLVFQYFWVVLMAQLSLGCHSIWIGLSLRSGQKTRIFLFLQHPTSLKLEVINNVLTQFWMNSSFSECKVFTEHFPRSVLEHPGGFGQTWDINFFRQQWFAACCLFRNIILVQCFTGSVFFCCYPCALTFQDCLSCI